MLESTELFGASVVAVATVAGSGLLL